MAAKVGQLLDKANKALAKTDYGLAAGLYEQVVGMDADAHQAWFGLGEIAMRLGQDEDALPFFEQASRLLPSSVRYLKRLGEVCCRVGLAEEGIAVLERARTREPRDSALLCSLSGAHVTRGEWHKAKELLTQVLALPGAKAAHYCLRGLACQQMGELDEALADFKKACRLDARYPDAWLNLGHLLVVRKRLAEAEECSTKLLQLAPTSHAALALAGDVHLTRGNFGEAAKFFRQATGEAADSAEYQAKLGLALVQCGDVLAAVEAMEKAHQMGMAEDWILEHLGLLFTTHGEMEVARENLEMALERNPGNLNVLNTLIVVYTKLGESDKARQTAEALLAIDPNYVNALLNLGSWYSDQARSEEALQCLRRVLEIDQNNATAYINSLWALVHSSEVGAAEILSVATAFDRNLCQAHRRQDSFSDVDRSPNRRLRIGWVTSDMRTHPVAAFVVPFLADLDRRQLEIFIYNNSMAADAVTAMARERSDKWREVKALGDDALADLIRADGIDIVVDLNGNTEGNRLIALARKPAPIMATWLGFPGTSGMSAMDYILVPHDPVLTAGQWCSETPWPLPDCYGVRTMIPDIPIQPGLPCERLGRPFTFACLNNFRKVSQKAIQLWSEILVRTPESRLILVARGGRDGALVEYIRAQFGRFGVSPDRLDIRGIVPQYQYFDAYNEADLCLDPFPFNGGTTGYDSLWMGVPFVTWPGDSLVSRMGRAILCNVDLAELVVDSAEAYVELAVTLAGDRERLKRLRENLRGRMQASPLMDAPRIARALEEAFRGMWLRWSGASG